jgi:predicted metal-dependent enzyme (double-stranded beta helix superfamily)
MKFQVFPHSPPNEEKSCAPPILNFSPEASTTLTVRGPDRMMITKPRTNLDIMLAQVTQAARSPLESRSAAVAEALADFVQDPQLLAGVACPCCPDRYIRHLLHADPQGGFAVVALVWRPGQMSPIHAHHTWCALGVHRGTLTESFYQRGEEGQDPATTATCLRRAGDVSHGPADPDLIHRLANLGGTNALSIHVYGVPYEQFGSDVNLVYAA